MQEEKTKLFNAQITHLQGQQIQKDILIEKSNIIAANYRKQLYDSKRKPGTSIVVIIIISLLVGILIGMLLLSKH